MQPDEVTELTTALRREYERAWVQITDELDRLTEAWPGATELERRRRLIQLQTLVRDLADAADELAARTVFTAVEGAYTLGAHATAAALAGAAAFTAVDTNAVTVFARDMYGDLLQATQGVRETTKETIRYLARERVRDKLVTGTTATQAARDLAKDLQQNGITSVVYKDGSRHGLREYTEVVTLTKTAEAYQVGGMNQMDAWGIEWCEIIDGPGCVAPGTRVLPYGDLTGAASASFTGPLYHLTARTPTGPHTVTVGPNHPMLTRRGWVRAHLLQEDDELVYDTRLEDPATLAELDLEQMPVVEDAFTSHVVALGSVTRPRLRHDLHGDAVFGEGEVEVVLVKGGLLSEGDACGCEEFGEPDLVCTDAGGELLPARGQGDALLPRVPDTTDRLVGGRGAGSPFVGPCPPMPPGQRLALPEGDPRPVQRAVDGGRLEPQAVSHLTGRQALVDVEPGHLVDREPARAETRTPLGAEAAGTVVVGPEGGLADFADGGAVVGPLVELAHGLVFAPLVAIDVERQATVRVYDLSTTVGAFSANGFVAKNCGLTSHDDPTPANGVVLPVSEARNYPLAHPRCRRTTVPRPDVANRREALEAKASAPTTPEDLARAQEQARQNAATAAARRRLVARTARTADGRVDFAADRTASAAQRRGPAAQAAAGTSAAAERALARQRRRAV